MRQAMRDLLFPEWRQALNDLMDIEKHYQRKEHLVFSCLERHGITGPSKVMWGKDDEVRGLLKTLGTALRQPEAGAAVSAGEAAASAVEEMIYKEEQILLPMCLDTLTEEEWAEIWAESPRYGWCLVEPREGYRPAESALPEAVRLPSKDAVQLSTGRLSLEQLLGIFSTLPVDITFVDAEDRVAFFSEGPDRVFARSKAVIGRKVQHCHPPRSLDTVDRIVSDFREGRQSVAEFWIDFQGRFVHIRYFAVRDAENRYLGTLEVTQDVTKIRALSGERRLLEYEGSGGAVEAVAPEPDTGWLLKARVAEEIDAVPMLAQGVHPLAKVRESAAALRAGEALRLISPFRPEPLIAAMRQSGFEVESREASPGLHHTYIGRLRA
jgi:DUF438 domain-containing protein